MTKKHTTTAQTPAAEAPAAAAPPPPAAAPAAPTTVRARAEKVLHEVAGKVEQELDTLLDRVGLVRKSKAEQRDTPKAA